MADAISILYKDTVTQVITPDGETDFFEITTNILQGNTPSPYLLIVALDYALREAIKDTSTGFMLEKRQASRKPAVVHCRLCRRSCIEFKPYGTSPTTSIKIGNGSRNYWVACKLQKNGICYSTRMRQI